MISTESGQRPRRLWVWALVTLATVAVFAVPFRLRFITPKNAMQHAVDSPVSYQRDISDLQVQANGGTVVMIRAGRPGQVAVSGSVSWEFRKPTVTQSWHGGSLHVGATCPKLDPFGACQVMLVVSVPAGTAVQAQAGSGSMTVTGLSGPVHLTATSGLLVARDVSGPVWATVTSGSVVAHSGITSQHFYVSASSGQIALSFSVPPRRVAVGLSSGSAEITVPAGSRYRVSRSVGPGLLDVAPDLGDAGSNLLLTATVGSGVVRIGYPAGPG